MTSLRSPHDWHWYSYKGIEERSFLSRAQQTRRPAVAISGRGFRAN